MTWKANVLQGGIALYAGLSFTLLTSRLEADPRLEDLKAYFAKYEPMDVRLALRSVRASLVAPESPEPDASARLSRFLVLYAVLPLVLVGPPTFVMGMSFPFLQKVAQRDLHLVGRRVGWLQSANIAGSMAGALVTGWVFLRLLGTASTLQLLAAAGGVFLLLWAFVRRSTWVGYAAVAAFSVAATRLMPSSTTLWAAFHGTAPERLVIAEDETGLTVIKREEPPRNPGRRPRSTVYLNGVGESWLPYGGVHAVLGFLSAMLHPHPRRIAIIGLGSGDTLYSAGGREETEEITCIEIMRSQVAALRAFQRDTPYPGIDALFADRRVRFVFTDGRSFIKREGRSYDLIEADTLRAESAYAGYLYSYEYYSLLKEHLAPGGYAVSWAPTPRVVRTFLKVFPEVVFFDFQQLSIAVGSTRPIDVDPDLIRARLRTPFARTYYAPSGIDLDAMAARLTGLAYKVYSRDFDRTGIVDVNYDLFPKDEFLAFVR